ncbi:MAG: transglycosylase, partial [Akkermansiaceae bacterium]|nr:transglycosylase [Akkermansiaceae bacterium]
MKIFSARRLKLIPRLALGALAAWLIVWYLLPFCFPLPAGLKASASSSPVLLDRHGNPIHHLVLEDSTRSSPVALGDIPPDLVECTLAAEDKRFPSHGGVDLLATLRAGKDAALHGRTVSGASTITQQVIKLSSPPAKRNLLTKLREAFTARHLEMSWSKPQILSAYFDRLNYGNHRIGPAEAARFYFQKPLGDLSSGECALLAGLPQAPSRLNPLKHPERALARREFVLTRLAEDQGPDDRIVSARSEPLRLRPLHEREAAPWLPAMMARGPVRTTLDLPLQQDVEKIVREELDKLKGSNLRHAAVVVIDNPTGQILALVSSGNWQDPKGGQINGALTPRSPGSALKPFTWLLAFEKGGLQPGSIVADIPTKFRTVQGLDMPQNYDRAFRGPVTVRQALACSLNVPAMRALNDLGGPQPLQELLLSLGMETIGADSRPYGLGLTLGNAPVRLLDLANAYATLARGGIQLPGTLTLPADDAPPPEGERRFSALHSYLIADILSDPEARAPSFYRGGPLELPFRCAAKTGTSSDFRDNWCLGFTADFTVGVWAGNFDNSPMKGLSGVAGAGPIFHRTILRVNRDRTPAWLATPPGLVQVALDPLTGKRLPEGPLSLVPADRVPPLLSAEDRDPDGHVRLDARYAEWLTSSYNRRRSEFVLAEDKPVNESLLILAPRDGAVYLLDPELPNGGLLRLASNLPTETQWS